MIKFPLGSQDLYLWIFLTVGSYMMYRWLLFLAYIFLGGAAEADVQAVSRIFI